VDRSGGVGVRRSRLEGRGEKGASGCAHRSRERRRPTSNGCGAANGKGAWAECRWGHGRRARSAYRRVGDGRRSGRGWVCEPGEDGVGGRAWEDGGRVSATAGARGGDKSRRVKEKLDLAAGAWAYILG
jgi:hypothetical protein